MLIDESPNGDEVFLIDDEILGDAAQNTEDGSLP